MGLNRAEWLQFAALRDVVGATDRADRWSCTTFFTDMKGRSWYYAAKHAGDYAGGGLAEPFVFQDFESLKSFLTDVPEWAREVLKKLVGASDISCDPWACHPVKANAPKIVAKPKPKAVVPQVDMTPLSGLGDLDSVLEILQQQDSVRNADLRARGWEGIQARNTLLEGVKSGKLAKHGSRGGTHYKLAA